MLLQRRVQQIHGPTAGLPHKESLRATKIHKSFIAACALLVTTPRFQRLTTSLTPCISLIWSALVGPTTAIWHQLITRIAILQCMHELESGGFGSSPLVGRTSKSMEFLSSNFYKDLVSARPGLDTSSLFHCQLVRPKVWKYTWARQGWRCGEKPCKRVAKLESGSWISTTLGTIVGCACEDVLPPLLHKQKVLGANAMSEKHTHMIMHVSMRSTRCTIQCI